MGHTFSNGEYEWDVADLWEAAGGLIPTPIRVEELADLDEPVWGPSLTPLDIVGHIRRIEAADETYPIILTPDGHIADGVHRTLKAILAGRSTVMAVTLPAMPDKKRPVRKRTRHGKPVGKP